MTAGDIWRTKTDEELIVAAGRLSDYTAAGQRIILAEIERRRLDTNTPPGEEDSLLGNTRSDSSDRNFAARLWHGEVSLPVTYWLWGVLGSRIALVPVLVLDRMAGNPILTIIALACYLGFVVIVFVATWRSSARYKGPKIWADLSRVAMALGVLLALAEAFLRRN